MAATGRLRKPHLERLHLESESSENSKTESKAGPGGRAGSAW
jgi:hypothetical protein